MESPQVIVDEAGRPAFAVIPWREYERLTGGDITDEDLSDEALYDRAVAEDEESFPIALVDRVVAGESAIRVYRQHRNGSVSTLSAIAKVLRVHLADLI